MSDPHLLDNADGDNTLPGPFDEQQRLFELLSQDTRHLIVQMVLGHPDHLMSMAERVYMVVKSKGAIRNRADELVDADVLAVYRAPENMDTRGLPSKFYGFSVVGVRILDQYNYLNGLPVARALYEKTRKTEQVERHEDAPRPSLPEVMQNALLFEEPS